MKRLIKIKDCNIDSILNPLIKDKISFSWSQTNTTSVIDVPCKNLQYSILDSLTRKEVFFAHSKIKSDLKKCNVIIDEVPQQNINYYSLTSRTGNNFKLNNIFCIDIKSAYPSALLNEKLISKQTFDDLQKLDKLERLKAIGMLASKKTVLYYEKGKIENYEVKVNDFYNFFFYTQYVIGEIMQEIENLLGGDFLFFWVDGIYFKNIENKEKIIDILKKRNYLFSIEALEYIEIIKKQKITVHLKPENKPLKTFNLPPKNAKHRIYQTKLIQAIK